MFLRCVFPFSRSPTLYQLDLHNKTCNAIPTAMKHLQKLDLFWVGYGYWKCMFVDFLIGYICPPNCVHCRVAINFWRRSPTSFKHVSLWCFLLFDPHGSTYQSNLGVHLRKSSLKTYLLHTMPTLAFATSPHQREFQFWYEALFTLETRSRGENRPRAMAHSWEANLWIWRPLDIV